MMVIKKLTLMVVFSTVLFSFLPELWARKQVNYGHLQSQYGKDLMAAPFYLRQKFLNDTGKAWPKATLQEKGNFLNAYFAQKKKEDQQKLKRQRIKATKERNIQNQKNLRKRNELRKTRQKQQAKRRELRNEQKKKMEFRMLINKQKQKMRKARQKR